MGPSDEAPSEGPEPSGNDNDLNILADAAMIKLGLVESSSLRQVSVESLLSLVKEFIGGKMRLYFDNWCKLTSDKHILDIIKNGVSIQMAQPTPRSRPIPLGYSEKEMGLLKQEIIKLSEKNVIKPEQRQTTGDFYSPVFLREKKDGTHRFILNLKRMNKSIQKTHFKMESIKNVIAMVQPGCWMATIDLKDAYYSVPVGNKSTKLLKFLLDSEIFRFMALPNGYRDAPRIFTKIMKPVFGTLRNMGYASVVYIDDSYLQGLSYKQCKLNVTITVRVLIALGCTIHPTKSVIDPTRKLVFLGFVINSITMTLSLTPEKRTKIHKKVTKMLRRKNPTIQQVAKLIGNLVATSEAVPLAPRYYRKLEKDKARALKACGGTYAARMAISTKAKADLAWWLDNIQTVYRSLTPVPVNQTIYTDASKVGWGAVLGEYHTQGQWLASEWAEGDINVAEITAAFFALKAFEPHLIPEVPGERHKFLSHVRLMIDNTTAVAYINHMGGSKSVRCNQVARQIWDWAEINSVWVSAAHVPGVNNELADYYSRKQNDAKEWALTKLIFDRICDSFGSPDIDLFASRTNRKIETYVSWYPDPESIATDAFTVDWGPYRLGYCFPPFSVVGKVLKKIREEKASVILIAPQWHTQSWYPLIMDLLTDYPLTFPASRMNLYLPHRPTERHPLKDKLHLMAVRLSGDSSRVTSFRRKLRTWSSPHGAATQNPGTMVFSKNGRGFVVEGEKIPFTPM